MALQQSSMPSVELTDSLTKIAGLLLSEEKLEAVLELVISLTSHTVPNADGASVTLKKQGRFTTAVYTDDRTRRVDQWQYAEDEGPCLQTAITGEVHIACDLAEDSRWPGFAALAREEGIESVLAVPFVPNGHPIGTLNIYSTRARAFGNEDVDTASLLAQQAAIVIANSVAYSDAIDTNQQLHEALMSREVIGQAKGILMERERITADHAFDVLKEVSQRTNRKLRDVAQDVVDSAAPGA